MDDTDACDASVVITVLGPFQVATEAGRDLTPKGAKNQALLALLALSPTLSRPRRWLEDKLWSTFASEQASANLRQALSKVRTALGPVAGVLSSDRSAIALDKDRVRVDIAAGAHASDGRTELLQGLDVRDPEFEEWLRMERMELQNKTAQTQATNERGILIGCHVLSETFGTQHLMGEVLANQIGETVAEQVRSWRMSGNAEIHPASRDVDISCQIISGNSEHALFLKATHSASGRILYSKVFRLDRLEDILDSNLTVAQIVFEAADQVIGKLPQVLAQHRPESRATALSRLALYRMFSFEQDALREADVMMKQAYSQDQNAVYLAWGSMIRMIQMVELAGGNREELREEAVALQYSALETGADNALVHAIVSKVRGIAMKDKAGVLDYARTATDRNPASAFAWQSMAEAHLMNGQHREALDASARARLIARASPFKHWWDTGHCIICIASDRIAEAIEAGEAAARAAPLSRPAHRHLLALYATENRLHDALQVADRLRKIEPGFSLDRFVHDETYPVRTLRGKGLLTAVKALL